MSTIQKPACGQKRTMFTYIDGNFEKHKIPNKVYGTRLSFHKQPGSGSSKRHDQPMTYLRGNLRVYVAVVSLQEVLVENNV